MLKGYKHTEESKKKMSMAHKGQIPWNKGKTGIYSKEHREKISEFLRKRIYTEETKRKMSEAHLGMKKPWAKGFPKGSIPWNKGLKTGIVPNNAFKKGVYTETMRKGSLAGAKTLSERKTTSIEKKVYDELKARGILFEKQKIINGKFLIDAYIPSLNLIIEADGDYWHSLDRVKKKDKAENAYLIKCGYKLLRLSEIEINNSSFKEKLRKELRNELN